MVSGFLLKLFTPSHQVQTLQGSLVLEVQVKPTSRGMLGKVLRRFIHFSWSRKSELDLMERSCSRVDLVWTRFWRVASASISLS